MYGIRMTNTFAKWTHLEGIPSGFSQLLPVDGEDLSSEKHHRKTIKRVHAVLRVFFPINAIEVQEHPG